jgi:hypothetical protein
MRGGGDARIQAGGLHELFVHMPAKLQKPAATGTAAG